jgi:hypothetical protein
LLRDDLEGFVHPPYVEGDEVILHEYTHADVLTCNAHFFVGRMNCRGDAPANTPSRSRTLSLRG